jgi:peptidoglycan/LPS O-acetylase OafA/YrhL
LAILLVVLCHYIGNSNHTSLNIWIDRALWMFRAGWSGVDLFFVLSGFLIGGILLDSRNSSRYYRTFYLRRAHRILPIYYLWLLLVVVTVGILQLLPGGRAIAAPSELRAVPKCIFFLQNVFSGFTDFQWRWLVVTWSLAVEEQFYLFPPFFIRLLSVRRLAQALVAFIVVSPLARLSYAYYFPGAWLNGSLAWRADTIAFGMLAAIAWRSPARQFLLSQTGSRSLGICLPCGGSSAGAQVALHSAGSTGNYNGRLYLDCRHVHMSSPVIDFPACQLDRSTHAGFLAALPGYHFLPGSHER